MDNTKAPLRNTQLANRVLWYDGDSAYDPARLLEVIRTRDVHFVTKPDPLVDQYNQFATDHPIKVKSECRPLTHDWTIPDAYKNLDVVDYLFRAHLVLFDGISGVELDARERRLAAEILLFEKYELNDVLRAIIWIINTLTANDTVWGVGRGSSVSSYVLYVIGVHDVDSHAYDLDIDDFLHE